MKAFENDLVLEGDRIIEHKPAISDKALRLNLNKNIYGTFSEIGAGQETVRHFFRAGGSSRTIAKAMSAYDKQFSDAIYSVENDGRYVTESRLKKMLEHECLLMEERLTREEHPQRIYFSYANTVATIDFAKKFKGHGWVGIRFQTEPDGDYNEIILHIQFKETDSRLQQQTLGVLGVNLIYGAFYQNNDPKKLISQLYDHLDKDQLDIDTINFSGPIFKNVDNRLMSLYLVKNGMAEAVMFGPHGKNILPANTLFRKNILLLRGSFRPVTIVNMNMYKKSLDIFVKHNQVAKEDTSIIFEITLNNLLTEGDLNEQDFLDRAELLCHLGQTVMISNFKEYYKVVEYCSQYSKEKIGLTIGVSNLIDIFDSKYYNNLSGGVFEALGKLFNRDLQVYLYPMFNEDNEVVTSKNLMLNEAHLQPIYQYFLDNKQIIDIDTYEEKNLKIFSRNVLRMIQHNESDWEVFLPEGVADIIKTKKLFQKQ
ncbi:TonB-dependent receptor [Myroides ceti]|uniref:TonB-dependent receptor n=1 Tax=Paenimyroides ceti TaxID=395087 RepID=A0ABT8CQF1_9FLAO|nr:TonB-dependent receptor [Paenimyroides ceti]MDN3706727.1 TonB-dependent receptor [Paenimyroides ceti]MDN3709392.1 TonB-dependent receptor [Paenimyroides ceti]